MLLLRRYNIGRRAMHGLRADIAWKGKRKKGSGGFRIQRGWKSEIQFAYCRSEMIYSRGPVADSFPLIYARPSKHDARGLFPYLSTCPVIIAIIHPGLTRHSYKNIDPRLLLLFLPAKEEASFFCHHFLRLFLEKERGTLLFLRTCPLSPRGKWRNVGD